MHRCNAEAEHAPAVESPSVGSVGGASGGSGRMAYEPPTLEPLGRWSALTLQQSICFTC
jgi:hypothetical protein